MKKHTTSPKRRSPMQAGKSRRHLFRGEPDCDHKFIDSIRCLKCGWMPYGPEGRVKVGHGYIVDKPRHRWNLETVTVIDKRANGRFGCVLEKEMLTALRAGAGTRVKKGVCCFTAEQLG